MEKKTIGAFIAALRRAGGMTQKELGDKLFVSDKTVSRWERDECAPDLNLIPAIAEIFDVTADELIRGERKGRDVGSTRGERGRTEKRVLTILRAKRTQHCAVSACSVGGATLGVIAAAICNFGFYRAVLGFIISLAFFLGAAMVEVCYTMMLAYVHDDGELPSEAIREYNTSAIKLSKNTLVYVLCAFGFVFPLVFVAKIGMSFSLDFEFWLLYGVLSALIAFFVGHAVYRFVIMPKLSRRGIVTVSEREREIWAKQKKMLKRHALTASAVAAVLLCAMLVLNLMPDRVLATPEVFYTWDDFKEFAERKVSYYGDDYDSVYSEEIGGSDIELPPVMIMDKSGNVLCVYYANNQTITATEFSFDTSDDGLPVYVYTNGNMSHAYGLKNDIASVCIFLIYADIIVTVALFLIRSNKIAKGK